MSSFDLEDYKSYPVCVVPAERHYNSYLELVSDIKKFEKSRAYLYSEESNSIEVPLNMFEEVQDIESNTILLLPTAIDYCILYRGQSEYHNPCLPTLYRKQRTELEMFVEQIRIMEFKLLLDSYPLTKYFYNKKYNVDYIGLAQHYGLNTDVLDLTSDVMIALFFAMCDYDSDYDKYKPKLEDKEYIGYLYAVLTPSLAYGEQERPFNFSKYIKPIGLQPFKRPGLQKGFSLHVQKDNPTMRGYLYSFTYRKEDSEYIYNKYNEGSLLWYKDEIEKYVKDIKQTFTFSSQAVSLAARKWGKDKSVTKWIKLLKKEGYKLVSKQKQFWFSRSVKLPNEDYKTIQEQICARDVFHSDRHLIRRNTFDIGRELISNLMYGSVDSPKGYDSGISININNQNPIYGLSINSKIKPLEPNINDCKIHAKWINTIEKMSFTRSFKLSEELKTKVVRM